MKRNIHRKYICTEQVVQCKRSITYDFNHIRAHKTMIETNTENHVHKLLPVSFWSSDEIVNYINTFTLYIK